MKSAKPLIFHFLINLGVILAVVGVTFLTENALAILGLTFLQSMPVFPPEHMVEGAEPEQESAPIGFVTD